MRKLIVIALCVNALLLAGRFWQEWRHVVFAGGELTADQNGDVNGDARLDMSDAIYLLLHIFSGGPEPVALAQAQAEPGLEESLSRTNELLEEIANPCKERPDRFIDHEDGTVTDTCTGLMWRGASGFGRGGWEAAMQYCEDLLSVGYDDWRCPTALELRSIIDDGLFRHGVKPPIRIVDTSEPSQQYWTSTERLGGTAWACNFNRAPRFLYMGKTIEGYLVLPVRTAQ